MRFRNTLALAVLFLALGGYLYFIENPRHEEATEQKKLVRFKPEDASEITLTYSDKQIVLKKTGAGWQMQKPIDVDADQVAVSNLVRAVADAEVKRTLEGGSKSLEVYGLDKPEAIVSIVLSNGAKLPSIRVGKTAPVGFSAYAQLEGTSNVKLVPSVFQTGLKRDVKDLRSKTIIDFQDADVQQVEITTPQSTIHPLVRATAGPSTSRSARRPTRPRSRRSSPRCAAHAPRSSSMNPPRSANTVSMRRARRSPC